MNRLEYLKLASEIHSRVKNLTQTNIEKNKHQTIFDLRIFIHKSIIEELNLLTNITSKGLAFPIGINGDPIVAHYTTMKISNNFKAHLPYYLNPDTPINNFNILKIDYGIHICGNIIDKAFSINIHNTPLEELLIEASFSAVEHIKKEIGIDARLNELAKGAREIVESYEHNNSHLKIVENVYSHNILPWKIHGEKFIKPDFFYYEEDLKVKSGEQYAIEIYASDGEGKGILVENPSVHSHYRLKEMDIYQLTHDDECNQMLSYIKDKRNYLPFCPNMCNLKIGKKKLSHSKISSLCQKLQSLNFVESYPPIIEKDYNSKVSQIEENIIILDNETKVVL